jgi:protein disulfide-isomerase
MTNVIAVASRSLLAIAMLMFATAAFAAELPYNDNADAKADVRQALIAAHHDHKPVLLIFGANWCEDCRALDHSLKTGKNAELIANEFEVVKIDVGRFNRNMDLAKIYGDATKKGIPSAVLLSPDSQILYATRAGELADARRMNDDGVYGFFRDVVAKTKPAN